MIVMVAMIVMVVVVVVVVRCSSFFLKFSASSFNANSFSRTINMRVLSDDNAR
jgi:hypothetical protein